MEKTISRKASQTCVLFAIGMLALFPPPGAFASNPMGIPLFAYEPNNGVWQTQRLLANGGQRDLNEGGSYNVVGTIQIDGAAKQFMGSGGGTAMTQQSLIVNCTQTIYTFTDQAVKLTVTFTAPKLLDEYDAISRPINYVTFDVVSLASASHTVRITLNGSGRLNVGSASGSSQTLDLGSVGSTPVSGHILVGSQEVNPVSFLGTTLRQWWNRGGTKTFAQAFTDGEAEYARLYAKCRQFDSQVISDAIRVGDTCYAQLCGQTYRQTLHMNKLVALNATTPFFFSREGCSGNLIQTIDVVHPQCPLFFAYNPAIMEAFLDPVFYLFETANVCQPTDPPPHDLGPWPNVTRNCALGYWVEEASNMMIMTAAVAHLEKSPAYIQKHWAQVSRWANWLRVNGLDPVSQNSTDDFSGSYPHSCLLAIKACLGIGGYVKMATMAGHADSAAKYRAILDTAVAGVISRGYDYQARHFKRANDQPSSWSQKYNLAWDKPLGLNVFSDSIAVNEMKVYRANVKPWGVPLLSGEDYNKSDWELFSATITRKKSDFLDLMHAEWNFLNANAFACCGITDWHRTSATDAKGYDEFGGRGVAGGYFMQICADKCLPLPPSWDDMTSVRRSGGFHNSLPRLSIIRAGNTLQVAGAAGSSRAVVADMFGRIVKHAGGAADRGTMRMDIAGLASGNYTAVVRDDSGESRSVRFCIAQ